MNRDTKNNYSVFDTHCDTLCCVRDDGKSLNENDCHVDLKRMSEYKSYTQVFACFIDPIYKTCGAERTMNLTDTFHTHTQNLPQNVKAVLSIEGGEGIYSLSALRNYHRLGVKIAALTWNYSNHIASGALESDENRGLTDFGKKVVAEMNKIGMLIDVSHLNRKSFYDIAKVTKMPIVATHSCSDFICPHKRNLTDEQFKIIKNSGGCVGVNFYPPFLTNRDKCGIDDIVEDILKNKQRKLVIEILKGFLKMPKFFVTQDKISDNQIIIDSEDVTHISRVLRLEKGDNVTVCDGQGTDYDAQIDTIEPKKILLNIVSRQKSETEPNIKVTLFQALPKASKMEYIIQKTTELGISEIVPVKLSRCVVKIDNKKDEKKKIDRWQKIAESAAKQSGRGIVPTVSEFMTINEVIEKSKEFDLFFVPYECEEQKTLKEILTSKSDVKSVGFVIGPEGGFDLSETEKLHSSGIDTVTLGKRILRTETAGEAVLAMTMYEIGDIN